MEIDYEERIKERMAEAERKAWDSLAGYKFWMFGYHAAQWVAYSHLLGQANDNPFQQLVKMAQLKAMRRKSKQ